MSEKSEKEKRRGMSIAEEMADIKNQKALVVTLTVTPEGLLSVNKNRAMTIDQLRSLFLEAIISTIIDQSVKATQDTISANQVMFDKIGKRIQ